MTLIKTRNSKLKIYSNYVFVWIPPRTILYTMPKHIYQPTIGLWQDGMRQPNLFSNCSFGKHTYYKVSLRREGIWYGGRIEQRKSKRNRENLHITKFYDIFIRSNQPFRFMLVITFYFSPYTIRAPHPHKIGCCVVSMCSAIASLRCQMASFFGKSYLKTHKAHIVSVVYLRRRSTHAQMRHYSNKQGLNQLFDVVSV